MTGGEIASLVAAVVSVCIGGLAIWLSVTFYKMSSQLSQDAKEASKDIGASVERLEKVFDKLYSDTFSMVKDTMSDMRRHFFREGTAEDDEIAKKVEKKVDEKLDVLRKGINDKVSALFKRQNALTGDRLDSVTNELRGLVDRAITGSREAEIEAREETAREYILQLLRESASPIEGIVLVNRTIDRFPNIHPVPEIEKMRDEDILFWEGEFLGPTSVVRLRERDS